MCLCHVKQREDKPCRVIQESDMIRDEERRAEQRRGGTNRQQKIRVGGVPRVTACECTVRRGRGGESSRGKCRSAALRATANALRLTGGRAAAASLMRKRCIARVYPMKYSYIYQVLADARVKPRGHPLVSSRLVSAAAAAGVAHEDDAPVRSVA